MAIVNRVGLNGNDITRESRVGLGKLGFSLATLTSGDVYQVCVVPEGSVVKSVNTVVTTAFNGTTPTVDIGVTSNGALYEDNLDVTSAGLTVSSASDAYYGAGTVVTVTPTFTDTTVGELMVYVEYLTQTSTGAYATIQ